MKAGYARKRDENEPEIIEALEAVGAIVYPVDKPLDLVVIYRGLIWLLEVKNGAQPPSWQRITPEQREFLDMVYGHTRHVHVVNSVEAALEAVGYCDHDLRKHGRIYLEDRIICANCSEKIVPKVKGSQ